MRLKQALVVKTAVRRGAGRGPLAAIGLFVAAGILALVLGVLFGSVGLVSNQMTYTTTENGTTVTHTLIDQNYIQQVQNASQFGSLGIFLLVIIGIIALVGSIWFVARNFL